MIIDLRVLLLAGFILAVGLGIYLLATRRGVPSSRSYYQTVNIAWAIIALAPVILLFSGFPDSAVDGTILGVRIGGAIGAFILIYVLGTRRAFGADMLSSVEASLDRCKKEAAQLDQKLRQIAPVHGTNGEMRVPKPLPTCEKKIYTINAARKRQLGILTGDIIGVKGVDCWVNSENTEMQMARFFDLSISAFIRYWGATKDDDGNVTKDTIGKELSETMGPASRQVGPATVKQTGSGELANTHGVKRVLHVAAVRGTPGAGYQPVPNIGLCVSNVLTKADEVAAGGEKLSSILFPILGSGTARGNLRELVSELFYAAISYCENKPSGNIRYIYFLAYTDVDLETCQEVLDNTGRVTKQE